MTGVAADPQEPEELPAGRLYTLTYDALNRVDTATAHYLPGGDRVLDSDYDRFGNRSGLTHTGDGSALAHVWRYDDLDRLFQAVLPGGADPSLVLDYYANDELQTLTHESGATTDFIYHPHGPIQDLVVANPAATQLLELAYTPDALLHVDALTEQHGPSDPTEPYDYEYDAVSRLELADYPAAFGLPADEGFAYDGAGNRDDDPQVATPWSYDGNNRIEASPGRGYQFDADGNLTQVDDGQPTPTTLATLGWDFTSRLRSYDNLVTGETASYLYDPFGRRIRKVVDDGVTAVTTFYLWDGDQLLAEYDGAGSRSVRYAYAGGFAPVEVAYPDGASGEDVYAVHTDHLDTPRLLTDAGGAPVWRAAYEAFGEAHVDPGSTLAQDFHVRFPGQYYDPETELAGLGSGLHYNRYRYYDPSLGRYSSADPLGQLHFFSLPLSSSSAIEVDRDVVTNLFTYVENRPLIGIDPLGLAFLVAGANANAVVGGGGGGSVGAYIGWHQGAQANQGWFGTPFDAGFFGSADFSGGLDFGIGGFAGAVKSITGTSVNVNASALFFQGSASFNPCFPSNSANINSFLDFLAAAFGSFNGATAGLNVGSPVGATVGVSHTVTSTQGVRALAGALGF